jgi:hypothetical protein
MLMTDDDLPGSQEEGSPQSASAAGEQPQPASDFSVPNLPAPADPFLADPFLALTADIIDGAEKERIANQNRLRQLTRDIEDSDGRMRGFGLDESHPDVARLAAIVVMQEQVEHQATLNLQRMMRKHPLGAWAKTQKGIGDKQIARLLAAIGDPYIRPEIERADGSTEPARPRGAAELWAYCGYHVKDGIAARRKRGEHANWNAAARMRAYLVAESCIKQSDTRYRAVYDAARLRYAEAVHEYECIRCGPRGSPKPPGSPLSEGHKHGRGLRAVAKEVLLDLWKQGHRIHTGIGEKEDTDEHGH